MIKFYGPSPVVLTLVKFSLPLLSVYLHDMWCVPQFTGESQRTTVWSHFIPSTFAWVAGVEFRLSGLSSKHICPVSYLASTDLTVLDPCSVTFLTYLEINGKQAAHMSERTVFTSRVSVQCTLT